MNSGSLRISIITPSFNQGHFIRATIDSVLQQDYQNIEHIIVDGGSTDETLDILRSYDDPRMTWMSEPDRGQSDAINKGMRLAKGEILAYLNSDDLYLPGALSFVTGYFQMHPNIGAIYGNCATIDNIGQTNAPDLQSPPLNLTEALKNRLPIAQQSVFWRREVMERIGLFDETLHYRMDRDYWLRMMIAASKCSQSTASCRFSLPRGEQDREPT